MSGAITVRPEAQDDAEAIAEVTRAAFDAEAEVRLVAALRRSPSFIPALSLVAVVERKVCGHLMMTHGRINGASATSPVLALGPVSVAPPHQRRGIGSAMMGCAMQSAADLDHRCVIVLGHPDFYGRFGFERASRYGVRPSFDAPDEAFMLATLGAAPPPPEGIMEYAEPFADV